MQRKSAKLLNELNRMKTLGGIINENFDDFQAHHDTDWQDVATERRAEAVGKIEKEFGPQNQYSGSADWGGIPTWSVLGDKFEGYFIIYDSEFQSDKSFSLMKRTFNPDIEENDDEIIFTAFLTPERYGDEGDGTIDELIEKAREIKTQNLNENNNISINARLSSKQGIKNAIYKILEMNKVEGRYRDKGWGGITKFVDTLREVGAEVDLLRSNYEGHGEVKGDYEVMPTRKVFYYEISVRNKKGNVVTIPFKVTCAFVGKTGTMEDDVYELTYYAMA